MQELVFKCPINNVSFGNVSLNLMREMFNRKMSVAHFPIGNPDASVYDKLNPDFKEWLQACIANRFKLLRREIPTLQLWHLNGAENRITSRQFLVTFYELNSPTLVEKNITSIQEEVLFSSTHAEESFRSIGCQNVSSVPMGFDPDFHITNKTYLSNKIHFGLMGKWENRKNTGDIIRLWASRYGNNHDYQLTCCIHNPFMQPDQLQGAITQALKGERYGNINFLPFLKTNSEVNDFLNSLDIDLSGLSGGEGWNLPSFNATALGKWSLVLNATSHKDWATELNSIQVQPNGSKASHDGVFFHQGTDFNQGTFSTFDPEDVLSKMEEAEKKCQSTNTEGLKLQKEFTYAKTLDIILDRINKQFSV